MKKVLTYLLFIVCTVFVGSCNLEKMIEIDNSDISPHWVLNSLLSAGKDTTFIYVTRSEPYRTEYYSPPWVDNYREYPPVEDATLQITINNKLYDATYSKEDSAYVLLQPLAALDQVKINMTHQGEQVESTTIIPQAPEILAIDTFSAEHITQGRGNRYLDFKIRLKDVGGENNYFRLLVTHTCTNCPTVHSGYFITSTDSYETTDPVLLNGSIGGKNDSDLGLAFTPGNPLSIFRDQLFEGREYTLRFSIDYRYGYWISEEEVLQNHLSIQIQAISGDLYKYYSTLQSHWYLSRDKVSEPVVIHSNIEGGLGILGAAHAVDVFNYTFDVK